MTDLTFVDGNIMLWNDFKAKDFFASWPNRQVMLAAHGGLKVGKMPSDARAIQWFKPQINKI